MKTFSGLLAAGLFAAGVPLAMASPPAAGPDSGPGTISVTGSAATRRAPDLGSLRFGVEVQAATAEAALSANSERMLRVILAVKQTGIQENDISTAQFNIHPLYEHRKDRETGAHQQVLSGYRASNVVIVETGHLDLLAEVIDAAVGAGANRIERVAFLLSPPIRHELSKGLIAAAVLDARKRADTALAPLGYRVAGVKDMSLTEFSPPAPSYADAGLVEMARSAPAQVFASDQDVRVTVNVTFHIGRNEPD